MSQWALTQHCCCAVQNSYAVSGLTEQSSLLLTHPITDCTFTMVSWLGLSTSFLDFVKPQAEGPRSKHGS